MIPSDCSEPGMSQKVHLENFQGALCLGANMLYAKNEALTMPRGNFQQGNGCLCVLILPKQSSQQYIYRGPVSLISPYPGNEIFFSSRADSSFWLPIDSTHLGPYYRRHTHLPLLLAICPPFCGFLSLLIQRHHGGLGLYF